jgi:hypothetical protein
MELSYHLPLLGLALLTLSLYLIILARKRVVITKTVMEDVSNDKIENNEEIVSPISKRKRSRRMSGSTHGTQ